MVNLQVNYERQIKNIAQQYQIRSWNTFQRKLRHAKFLVLIWERTDTLNIFGCKKYLRQIIKEEKLSEEKAHINIDLLVKDRWENNTWRKDLLICKQNMEWHLEVVQV